jgi:hypothetical protein
MHLGAQPLQRLPSPTPPLAADPKPNSPRADLVRTHVSLLHCTREPLLPACSDPRWERASGADQCSRTCIPGSESKLSHSRRFAWMCRVCMCRLFLQGSRRRGRSIDAMASPVSSKAGELEGD